MRASNRINQRYFLIASVIACTLGCGDANRGKIIGTWGIERADTVMNRINRSDSNVDGRDDEAELDSEPPHMTLKFLRSGQLETSTRMGAVNREKQGTWQFVSFDPSTQSMNLRCEINSQETEHEVSFLDSKTIKLVPPNMAGTKMKIKFKRQD